MNISTAVFGTIMVVVAFALGFFRGFSVGVTETEARWDEAVTRADERAKWEAKVVVAASELHQTWSDGAPCCACAQCWDQHDALAAVLKGE